jgi:hypothetical protein
VTVNRAFEYRTSEEPQGGDPPARLPETSAMLAAVRDDVRQTLRSWWLDPAIESATTSPVFFTAAWSAIRPNVGKSFLLLARALRTQAVEIVRVGPSPDLRKRLEAADLSEADVQAIEEAVRAAQLVSAKTQIVVHALSRAARRDRIPGTGREEPPVRRGVPEWQRTLGGVPLPAVGAELDDAAQALSTPSAPMALRLVARWPAALSLLWEEVAPFVADERWRAGATRLRRIVRSGVDTLPHPIDLQWPALRDRGITEEERVALADTLTEHDRAAADQTLLAAFAWVAMGGPDIGVES